MDPSLTKLEPFPDLTLLSPQNLCPVDPSLGYLIKLITSTGASKTQQDSPEFPASPRPPGLSFPAPPGGLGSCAPSVSPTFAPAPQV